MKKQGVRLRPEIKIQNTVCTADLKQEVGLSQFNRHKHLSANLDLYRCRYVKDDSKQAQAKIFLCRFFNALQELLR